MLAITATYPPKMYFSVACCTCMRFRNMCSAGLPLQLRYSDNTTGHENHLIILTQLVQHLTPPPPNTPKEKGKVAKLEPN